MKPKMFGHRRGWKKRLRVGRRLPPAPRPKLHEIVLRGCVMQVPAEIHAELTAREVEAIRQDWQLNRLD